MIEVVLALGVLSFAVIPMIAMLGGSLQIYRHASQDMVGRQILTQLASDAQQSPRADLITRLNQTVYFDVEGNPLESSGDSSRVYTATVDVIDHAGANPLSSQSLLQVQISVKSLEQDSEQQTSLQVFPQS